MATTLEELQILITSETSGLRRDLAGVRSQLNVANKDVNRATSSIGSTLKKLGGVLAAVFAVKAIVDFGKAAVGEANETSVAEAKLTTIMRQRMGATDAVIKSVKELAEAQETIGVVGAGEQIAGAQELATYLEEANSLKTLIPVMNDLVAQQFGLSSSAEQVTGVATMLGKVMDGQVGALSRYGFTFDEAQEKILKYGTEAQRSALLVDIVKDSLGNMNVELGKTPQGQMKQLQETLGGIRESIGIGLMSAIQTVLPYLTAMANVILKAAQYFQMLMAAIFGTAQMSTAAAGAASSVTDAQTEAGDAAEKAGKKAKGSVSGFDEINSLADKSDSGGAGGSADGGGGLLPEIQMPEMDTETIPAGIQKMVDEIKGILSTIGDEALSYGKNLKDAFSGIRPALQPLIDAKEPIKVALGDIGNTAKRLMDDFLKPVADYIILDFVPSITTAFVESFAPVFAETAIWAVEEFAKTFQNVTDAYSELWNTTWKPSLEDLKTVAVDALPQLAEGFQTLLDGTIKPFVDYFLNDFVLPIAKSINETLVPIFASVLVWGIKEYVKWFTWGANLINDIYKTVIRPVFDLIKTIVLDTLTIITNLWEKYGATLLNNLSELMDGIRETFQLLWDVVLKPIIEPFLKELTWLWDKHLKELVDQIGEFIMKLANAALEIYNKFIKPIMDWVIKTLGPAFVSGFNYIVDVLGSAVAMIADVLSGVIKILGGVIDFITGVFTGNWQKAWEGIKDIFAGIWDALQGVLKGALNIMIGMINTFIKFWNTIELKVPAIEIPFVGTVGGFSVGVPKIGEIPKLARGGIIDSPTLAMVGEAGKEAVIPLENTSFVNTLASALGSAVMAAMQMTGGSQSSNSGNGDVVIQLDGTTMARVLNPFLANEQSRIGSSIIQPI